MFRRRRGAARWHFCENCPHWPWDTHVFELSTGPPFSRWCRTCVLMLEADTGDVEWPHDESFAALEDAWESGRLTLRPKV